MADLEVNAGEPRAWRQEIAEIDYNSRLHTAERIGMELGIAEGIAQGMEQGMEPGIRGLISGLLDFNVPREAILSKLQEKYDLSELEALSWYEKVSK